MPNQHKKWTTPLDIHETWSKGSRYLMTFVPVQMKFGLRICACSIYFTALQTPDFSCICSSQKDNNFFSAAPNVDTFIKRLFCVM